MRVACLGNGWFPQIPSLERSVYDCIGNLAAAPSIEAPALALFAGLLFLATVGDAAALPVLMLGAFAALGVRSAQWSAAAGLVRVTA